MQLVSCRRYLTRIGIWIIILLCSLYGYSVSGHNMEPFFIGLWSLLLLLTLFNCFFVDIYADSQYKIKLGVLRWPVNYRKLLVIKSFIPGLKYTIFYIKYLSVRGKKKIRFFISGMGRKR